MSHDDSDEVCRYLKEVAQGLPSQLPEEAYARARRTCETDDLIRRIPSTSQCVGSNRTRIIRAHEVKVGNVIRRGDGGCVHVSSVAPLDSHRISVNNGQSIWPYAARIEVFDGPAPRLVTNPGTYVLTPQGQKVLDQCERRASQPADSPTVPTRGKKQKKRRGPLVKTDAKADAKLCADWKAAKGHGNTREAFARAKGIDVKDLIDAQHRVKYRRQRDAE
jgi:hypothetical protein